MKHNRAKFRYENYFIDLFGSVEYNEQGKASYECVFATEDESREKSGMCVVFRQPIAEANADSICLVFAEEFLKRAIEGDALMSELASDLLPDIDLEALRVQVRNINWFITHEN